jgi:simple sugar transport system ATP-binding protein
LGIAGVAGNGQLELEQAIAGLRATENGRIEIDGADITRLSTKARRELGLAYIPEDRLGHGTQPDSSLTANAIMGAFYRPPLALRGLLRRDAITRYVDGLVKRFDVAAGPHRAPLRTLSGGNIQKLVVAREVAGTPTILVGDQPRIVLASQPTRGVDVGAIEHIHSRLLELRDAGVAILLISFELDEIFFLSDRIRVLYNGRLSEELSPHEVTESEVGLLMGGASQ